MVEITNKEHMILHLQMFFCTSPETEPETKFNILRILSLLLFEIFHAFNIQAYYFFSRMQSEITPER